MHAYGHVLPGPSGGTPGTHSSGTSAHASLFRCLVTLGCSGMLSNTSSACCWPCSFLTGAWVPVPGRFLCGSSGTNHPAVFFFFTAIWRVLHPTFCSPPGCVVVSSTTSSDFNINFSLNPWYQLNSDVTGFGKHKPLRRMQVTIFHASQDVQYSVDILNLRHLHNVDDI